MSLRGQLKEILLPEGERPTSAISYKHCTPQKSPECAHATSVACVEKDGLMKPFLRVSRPGWLLTGSQTRKRRVHDE
jgi:hypothetical protein